MNWAKKGSKKGGAPIHVYRKRMHVTPCPIVCYKQPAYYLILTANLWLLPDDLGTM